MDKKGKVRVALVGIGAFSGVLANAMKRSKKIELVICFTRNADKRKEFSKKYGCDQDQTYVEVLKRDDIEGVILTTPNAIHAEQTMMAVQHRKHVFVEKPLANTLEDGNKMVKACEEAGLILMVGHDIRRLSGNRKVKELIDRGIIGKPVMVEANFSHDLGFRLSPKDFRWYGDDSGCPGGALMTMGIHHIDTLSYFLGPIKKAFSYFNHLYIPAYVDDVTVTIFQFESGILGYLGANYASPKAHWISVYGTEANLSCKVLLPEVSFDEYLKIWPVVDQYTELLLLEKGKDGAKKIPLSIGDPILEEIDEFADCIKSGKKPETDGRVGLSALALVRAAIESNRTGNQIEVPV